VRETIAVSRPRDLPGVELQRGVCVTRPYPRHWHEEYHLCLVEDGSGELLYRGSYHANPPGGLVVIAPGEVHANRSRHPRGCTFRTLYLDPRFFRQALEAVAGGPTEPCLSGPVLIDRDVARRYQALHRVLERGASVLERESHLLDTLVRLVLRHGKPRRSPRPVGRERRAVSLLREYIADNYAERISLADLAHLVDLSAYHLSRVFTGEVGMPPHAFQTQVRVANAKRLLRGGSAILQVALETGFADQSHLTRCFTRFVGLTPGAYQHGARPAC